MVEHTSLLLSVVYWLFTCQRALSALYSFLIVHAPANQNVQIAIPHLCVNTGRLCQTPARSVGISPSNGRLSGAFPNVIKKHSSVFGTGWDPSTPNLAGWPVISRHYSSISKRQLSERGQEGLWVFFFLHVWTGRYKGSREHVAASAAGSSQLECTNDLKRWT